MSFTIQNVEFYLLVLVRISTFIFSAPFFSLANVPVKVKVGIAVFLTILIVSLISPPVLNYKTTVGFAALMIKEAIVGLLIGYMANICYYILSFAGQIIDMEIGFSMVNILDPVSKIQTTVTGNYYSYLVMLMLMVTNLHYFLLTAIFDSFHYVPVGKARISSNLYKIMQEFITDYFIIGFRIILPIFGSILLVNVILAILAKIAPQMNMFVIGMQLKIFIGLFILLLMVSTIPTISDFIFEEMKKITDLIIKAMSP